MRLHNLVLRLSKDWEGFRVFRWAEGVTKTNNRTEQSTDTHAIADSARLQGAKRDVD